MAQFVAHFSRLLQMLLGKAEICVEPRIMFQNRYIHCRSESAAVSSNQQKIIMFDAFTFQPETMRNVIFVLFWHGFIMNFKNEVSAKANTNNGLRTKTPFKMANCVTVKGFYCGSILI